MASSVGGEEGVEGCREEEKRKIGGQEDGKEEGKKEGEK